ncbi:266_t:CDS:2 [Gigaspora margarita]|uniref:266_t:CDS:1 n=1 Tax=Gigaspora margarita TaxID=4874 RepID=A0ABN7UFI9_GIGMA|nr:266_t:CDS:2 [Gigaspora margarita]
MRVQNNTKKIATGKTPKWFTDMQQMLAKIEHPSKKEETNPFTQQIWQADKEHREKSQKLEKKLQLHTGNFTEITQELWSLYRSLRVPKMVRVNLIITNNVEMVDQKQLTASWEILNTGARMSLIARTWPSPLKNALLAIRSLGACLRENSRVKLTMNYKEIKQLIDITCKNKWNKDIVRQQSISTRITDIKVQELITENYMLMINNEAVALMGNKLLKELYRAKHKAQWLSQNRINEIVNAQEVNWPAIYELINYKYRPITRFASGSKSKIKAFIVKMITNKLPVALNLHIRQKEKFPNPICPRCTNEIEDEKHWLYCAVNETGIKEVLLMSLDEWVKKEDKKNKIQES